MRAGTLAQPVAAYPNQRFAIHIVACTIGGPIFLEIAVQTALRNSVDLLSMREVTCWRW